MSILSAFLVGLLAAGGDPQLKEFAAPDKSCKVQFPGTPQEKTQDASGIRTFMFLVEEKEGGYMLAYADAVPKGEEDAVVQKRLDGSRDSIMKNMGAKLTKESQITLDDKKYPGRELHGDLPNKKGIMRARIYLVDGRLYQVMVLGTQPFAGSDTATRFLSSLVLTKRDE